MIENLISGLTPLGDPSVIGMLILGNLLGFVFGVLPGLGTIQAMALVLPFTFGTEPLKAMFLYAGIMGSSPLGGAVTAILIRIPGVPGNVCTTIEGYAMTQRGEAARALAIAAFASLLGEFAGLAILVLILPVAEQLILNLRAPEIFWIVMLGVFSIVFVGGGNFLKGIVAAAIGMLLSLVGRSPLFPVSRFDLGTYYLWDGVKLVAFFVGIFAIPQIMKLASSQGAVARVSRQDWKKIAETIKETFRYPFTFIRSALIGAVVGIIPGLGASIANAVSYTTTVQLNKLRKDERPFGTGNVRGLVAAECSNNAKEGGALLTTVSFGIPGSAEMALLLGAFTLHGLQPGLELVTRHADLVWSLIIGLSISQFISMLFVLTGTNLFARVLSLRSEFVAFPVLLACLVGAYAIARNIWDLFVLIAAGFLSFGMRRYGFSVISMAIGFILAPYGERALGQSLQISLGDISILFTRPIAISLMVLVFLFMIVPLWGAVSRHRSRRHSMKHSAPNRESSKWLAENPVDRGAVIFALGLLLVVAAFFHASLQLGPGPGTVPLAASACALMLLVPIIIGEFVPNIQRYFETALPYLSDRQEGANGRPAESQYEKTPSAGAVSGMAALILILLPAVYFYGFLAGVPICFLVYLLVGRKMPRWSAFVFAAMSWAILYFVFDQLLQLHLWRGAGPKLIHGWLGGSIAPRFF